MTRTTKEIRRANLAHLLESRFDGNQAKMGRAIGRASAEVWQIVNHRNIGDKRARAIEASLGLHEGYLDVPHDTSTLTARSPTQVREGERAQYGNVAPGPDINNGLTRVPCVGTAQLGDDGYWDELSAAVGHGDGYVEAPTSDPNAYCLRVRGQSMAPAIRDGWVVLVEPNKTPQPGEYVLVKAAGGRKMIKEFLFEKEDTIHLLSVNEEFGRLTLDRVEVEDMQYVGGVLPPSKLKM